MPIDAHICLQNMRGSAFGFWFLGGPVSGIRGTIPFQNPVHGGKAQAATAGVAVGTPIGRDGQYTSYFGVFAFIN